MPSLWFCVPVHGRLPLASICLKQLRHTCDALTAEGIEATAVVISDRDTLRRLPDLGFATVERDNTFLSAKFNDGIQIALDDEYNPRPADYVVPFGSDDWVDWRIIADNLPANPRTVVGFQNVSFVRHDGLELAELKLDSTAGCGIRIYPRRLMASLGYRPADEDRVRACDTSILTNLLRANEDVMKVHHAPSHPSQIVDWKSDGQQLNPYTEILRRHRRHRLVEDPFDVLADTYPAELLDDMQRHYERALVAA